jgi:hypothetical protein
VTDIFQEVEEDVRRERLEKLWKAYGDYIIAGVAAVVIAIAGYQFWQRYEAQQALKASAAYNTAQQLADAGQSALAAETFGKIAKDAPGGYAILARLAQADTLLASGNRGDAVAIYKEIASKDDSYIGDVARIRGAWATAETAPRADLEKQLGPLTDPANPWQYMAREILAYSDYHAGNFKKAQAEYDSVASDTNAPDGVRQRCRGMAMLLKTGGDANVGFVPPPPADTQKGPIQQ